MHLGIYSFYIKVRQLILWKAPFGSEIPDAVYNWSKFRFFTLWWENKAKTGFNPLLPVTV